jgi:hypothetical protein
MMIETGIAVNVLSIPPRILFEAERMEHNNLLLPELTRGETAWVHLVAKNQGDEALHPLVARLFCQDKDVSITPQVFHTNEPVLIRVSTTQRPFGSSYTIELQVDYSLTKGAMGPARLFIQGSVRPTIWQSMLREVSLTQRLLIAVCLGGLGFMITGEMSIALAALSSLWALLVFPMVLLPVVGLSMNSILFHRQRAGKTPAFKHVFWLKLASGLASGTLLDVIYRTLDASVPLFLVGGIIGGLIGCIAGFISDIPAKI